MQPYEGSASDSSSGSSIADSLQLPDSAADSQVSECSRSSLSMTTNLAVVTRMVEFSNSGSKILSGEQVRVNSHWLIVICYFCVWIFFL